MPPQQSCGAISSSIVELDLARVDFEWTSRDLRIAFNSGKCIRAVLDGVPLDGKICLILRHMLEDEAFRQMLSWLWDKKILALAPNIQKDSIGVNQYLPRHTYILFEGTICTGGDGEPGEEYSFALERDTTELMIGESSGWGHMVMPLIYGTHKRIRVTLS